MFGGSKIKGRFFRIINRDDLLFGEFEVVHPKKVMYLDKVVNLTKLDKLSRESPIYLGPRGYKDSLWVPTNQEKIWNRGHIGYFTLFNALVFGDDEHIREVLGVDDNWDGEWRKEDIITGDEHEFIAKYVAKHMRNAGQDPTTYWHCPHITMVNPNGFRYEHILEDPTLHVDSFFSVDFDPHQTFALCDKCVEKAKGAPIPVVGDNFLVTAEQKHGKVRLVIGQTFPGTKLDPRYDAKLITGGFEALAREVSCA